MPNTPIWFDESAYFANKAEQLKSVGSEYATWNGSTVRDYFLKNGIDAYTHFVNHGNAENVSPNSLFKPLDYLQYKADQLNDIQYDGRDNWTVAEVQQAFDAAGLTAWDHYLANGDAEGVNPSQNFDVAAYYEAKAAQLNKISYEDRTDWTADDVKAAFAEAGITALEHYYANGKDEGVKVAKAAAPEAAANYDVYLKATTVSGAADFVGTPNADQVLAKVALTSLDFDGQAGDDTLFVSGGVAHDFGSGRVDGGEGADAIVLQGKNTSLNMSGADVVNVESLDLSDAGKQTVTMTADQFAAFGNGTAIAVSGVEDLVVLNAAPEEEGLVDATAFQGSLQVNDLTGLDVKVTVSQLANLTAVPSNGKIAVDAATSGALNNVSAANLAKVSDVILTGSQMDISKVDSMATKNLHFADDAIQDVTVNWTQLGKLAEFSDDEDNFALTAEDVLNVKITTGDSISSAPGNGKAALVDSLIVDNTTIDLTTAAWLTDETAFTGFVDLGSAKADVKVLVNQYKLLENVSSTDKVYVKTTGGGEVSLGDSMDTVDLSYLTPGTDSLTVEGFQTGKRGDTLKMFVSGFSAANGFTTLEDLTKDEATSCYILNASTLLLLNEKDYHGERFQAAGGDSSGEVAWILLQTETGLEVYKYTAGGGDILAGGGSGMPQVLSLDVTLAGVDVTDFTTANLVIAG